MFELTYKLLKETFTEERFDLFLKATDIITQFGNEDLMEQIEQYIMSKEENDLSILVAAVSDMMQEGLVSIVKRFGIEMNDDAVEMSIVIDLLIGLIQIEETEEAEMIYQIAGSEFSNEEKLSDILSIATAREAVDFHVLLNEVGDELIRNIREKLKFRLEYVPDEVDEEEVRTERDIIVKVKECIKVLSNKHLFVIELLRSTPKLGLSFEMYLTLFLDNILEAVNPKEITQNLYLLALMSSDGYKNPVETIKLHLEKIEPDLTYSSQMLNEARNLSISISGQASTFKTI